MPKFIENTYKFAKGEINYQTPYNMHGRLLPIFKRAGPWALLQDPSINLHRLSLAESSKLLKIQQGDQSCGSVIIYLIVQIRREQSDKQAHPE